MLAFMLSHAFKTTWLCGLILALVLTPLSQASAAVSLAGMTHGSHATHGAEAIRCHTDPAAELPAPSEEAPEATRCPYHCLTIGALLPALPLACAVAFTAEPFVEPAPVRVEYLLEVDLRPPIA